MIIFMDLRMFVSVFNFFLLLLLTSLSLWFHIVGRGNSISDQCREHRRAVLELLESYLRGLEN